MGESGTKYKIFLRITRVMLVIFIIDCIALVKLYRFDNNPTDTIAFDTFVKLEDELIYPEFDLSSVYDKVGLSAKLEEYNYLRSILVWEDCNRFITSVEDARSLLSDLYWDQETADNLYIDRYIFVIACYDVMAVIDPECEDYWMIRCDMLERKVIREALLHSGQSWFIISHAEYLLFLLVLIAIITFVINVITIFTAIALKKRDGK